MAEGQGPDLIFMDIEPPDIDGVKTTTILRQNPKTSHISVVALTAWISELWQEKALQVGIVTYLIKPVAPQTLKQTIERNTLSVRYPTQGYDALRLTKQKQIKHSVQG